MSPTKVITCCINIITCIVVYETYKIHLNFKEVPGSNDIVNVYEKPNTTTAAVIETDSDYYFKCPIFETNESSGNSTKENGIENNNVTCKEISQVKEEAENLWLHQKGYLWMMHSRKAGGTTLCMNLRLNMHGLVRNHKMDHVVGRRETCQILEFCANCDLKKASWYSVSGVAQKLRQTMEKKGRNFIEIEGSGAPENMLEQKVWDDFIFISTIRNPIDRIVSLLLNARPCARNVTCFHEKLHTFVSDIPSCCNDGDIYKCHSNYYVRIFSGQDSNYTTDNDMLARAKKNFLRFSCVVIVEAWEDTIHCLDRLGLHLHDSMIFNIGGSLSNNQRLQKPMRKYQYHKDENESYYQNSTHETHFYQNENLTPEELQMVITHNLMDIQFYEWVSEQVLGSQNYDQK